LKKILPPEGERDFEMEAELKLLFVAVGRCSERFVFAETDVKSPGAASAFRCLEQEELAEPYDETKHAGYGDVRQHRYATAHQLASRLEERAHRLTEMAKLYRLAGDVELHT